MRLITAHRILIGSAIAFFAFFAAVELRSYVVTGTPRDLASAVFGAAAAFALGIYLRTIWRR